jgi:hypothetical protein
LKFAAERSSKSAIAAADVFRLSSNLEGLWALRIGRQTFFLFDTSARAQERRGSNAGPPKTSSSSGMWRFNDVFWIGRFVHH